MEELHSCGLRRLAALGFPFLCDDLKILPRGLLSVEFRLKGFPAIPGVSPIPVGAPRNVRHAWSDSNRAGRRTPFGQFPLRFFLAVFPSSSTSKSNSDFSPASCLLSVRSRRPPAARTIERACGRRARPFLTSGHGQWRIAELLQADAQRLRPLARGRMRLSAAEFLRRNRPVGFRPYIVPGRGAYWPRLGVRRPR